MSHRPPAASTPLSELRYRCSITVAATHRRRSRDTLTQFSRRNWRRLQAVCSGPAVNSAPGGGARVPATADSRGVPARTGLQRSAVTAARVRRGFTTDGSDASAANHADIFTLPLHRCPLGVTALMQRGRSLEPTAWTARPYAVRGGRIEMCCVSVLRHACFGTGRIAEYPRTQVTSSNGTEVSTG